MNLDYLWRYANTSSTGGPQPGVPHKQQTLLQEYSRIDPVVQYNTSYLGLRLQILEPVGRLQLLTFYKLTATTLRYFSFATPPRCLSFSSWASRLIKR